ncbi:MAG: type II toxin-antitoxin system VapC family toxin [Gammaproteobacteria bacterium]|jgi:predicted nucleic acid-binding protein
MMFVLDCSVTMAWLFSDEMNSYSESILNTLQKNNSALVPGLWVWEVSNVLLVGQRRSRITRAQASGFWEILKSLPINVDEQSVSHAHDLTYQLAHEHHLSAYDAAYLEIALRKQIPIASLDKKLINIAKKTGIQCVP